MRWLEDLAADLAQPRRDRVPGTVVVLDFLRPAEQEALKAPLQRALGPSWGVFVVGDPQRRPAALSADRAVDLREDLGRRSFFLVIRDEAGAGLQGVYDVADVLVERQVLHRLRTVLRNRLRSQDRALEGAAWKACLAARSGKGAAESAYRREIDYLDAVCSAPTFEAAGRNLNFLGLIPERRLNIERLEANAGAIRDLMRVDRSNFVSHSERVRRLQLTDPELEAGITKALEGASSLFALEEWLPKLSERELTFEKWERQGDLSAIKSLDLHAWRQASGKPYKWSGLAYHGDHGLYFSLAEESTQDTLEVRWKAVPTDLARGAVEYHLQLLPAEGEEPLLQEYSKHRAVKGGLQKWQIPREHLQELGQEMTVRIQISVVGHPDVEPACTEDFLLSASLVPERRDAETSAKPVRSHWDLALEHVRAGNDLLKPSLAPRGQVLEVNLARNRRRLEIPAALWRLETILLQDPQTTTFQAALRPDGTLEDFQSLGAPALSGKVWTGFLNARSRLFRKFQKELQSEGEGSGLPLLLEALDLPRFESDIWEYARSYGQLLEALARDTDSTGPEVLSAALAVDCLVVLDSRGQVHSRILAPTHPLRMLWLLGYGALLDHWSTKLAALRPAERRKAVPADDVERLSPHLFPAFLGSSAEGLWAYADGIGLYWAILIPLGARDSQQRVADLLNALKLQGDRSVVASLTSALVKDRFLDFLDAHPYVETLQVNALEPGDGASLTRTLTDVRKHRDPEHGLRPRLDLRLCARNPESQPGRYLDRLALARRKNQTLTEDEARLFRSTGQSTSPGLQWAHMPKVEQLPAAHLCLLTDYFDGGPCVAPIEGPLKTPEVFGLSLPLLLEHSMQDGRMTWVRWVHPVAGDPSQRHPSRPAYTDWLVSTHRAILNAAVRLTKKDADEGDEQLLPGVALTLDQNQQRELNLLHEKADWVLTLDRYLGPEYFDCPKAGSEGAFSKFLLDYVPGQLDGTSHRMLLSTSRSDQVLGFLRVGLQNLGLSPAAEVLAPLLFHLKAVSGRVALHLGGPRSTVAEALALGTVHHHQATRGLLSEAILIPLESLLPPDKDRQPTAPQVLKVELSRQGRRESLDFSVLAIAFALDANHALSVSLRADLLAAADRTLDSLQQEFGLQSPALHSEGQPGKAGQLLTLPIRRRRLGRVLRSCLEKACRYGTLAEEAASSLARRLDQLTDADFDRLGSLRAEAVVVCPALRDRDERRIEESRGLVTILGAGTWPELYGERQGGLLSRNETGIADLAADATSVPASQAPSGVQTSPGPDVKACPSPSPVADVASGDGRPPATTVFLGRDLARGREVTFCPSVRSNPHLLLVGIPGTGKSTAVLNLANSLARQAVQPLVFDFHGDLTERMKDLLGDEAIRVLDGSKGLEFNPLRLSRRQAQKPGGWMDNVFEVAEIFGAIFPDLGDLQIAAIRKRLIQSYNEAGFRENDSSEVLDAPAFRRFYELMCDDPKPTARSQQVVARLDTMFLRTTFRSTDREIGIEELMTRPTALDLHQISGEQNQIAAASFFLHKVYKDMFERGEADLLRLAVVFDEAHRAARLHLLGTMMQESRKFGIMMVVSSQRAGDFHPRVIESTGNFLLLKVNPPDARTLAPILAGYEGKDLVMRKLIDQPSYHALFRNEGWRPYVEVALQDPQAER